MKKISNARYDEIYRSHGNLSKKLTELTQLTELVSREINAILETTENENGHNLATLIASIEEERDALYDLLTEASGKAESYYDDRSERWMESDAGIEYKEWADELAELSEQLSPHNDLFEFHFNTDSFAQGNVTIEACEVEINNLPRQSPCEQ